MQKKNAIREFLTRWTLSKKMTICLFVSTSFAMLVGMLLLYGSATHEATRLNSQLNENNLNIVQGNIEKQGQNIENTITGLFFDYDVKASILNSTASLNSPAIFNNVDKKFTTALASCSGILGIAVYKRNGEKMIKSISEPLPYSDFQSCIEYFTTQGGINEDNLSSSSIWLGLEDDPSHSIERYCLVNLRLLRNLSDGEISAIIIAYYNENAICNLYSFFGSQSFIMDTKDRIISAVDKTRIGETADISVLSAARSSGKRTIVIESNNTSNNVSKFCTWLPTLSCYLIAIPDNNVLSATQNTVLIMLLTLTILGLIFSFTSAWVLAKGLTKPITDLKLAMELARGGDLSVRFFGQTSDEIGYLGVTFNILMEDIAIYIQKIRRTDYQKQQSEIRMLQSQINPHLLYNTLDSALCLMTKNDTRTVIHILEELSRFFKLSLSKGNLFVTISTEISHIRSYMQLQKLCRNKQVELHIIGDQALLDAKIMKLTLQPIIENAYMHAFEGIVNDGLITIALSVSNSILRIEVTDNGIGIECDTLAKLKKSLLSSESTAGFGLWNINQRLKTCYSREYGLTIDSEYGEFTCVTVTMPYLVEAPEIAQEQGVQYV